MVLAAVQQQEKQNYFQLMGLEESYVLDKAVLEKKYFDLQRQYHPDRFAAKADGEKLAALQVATEINHAYDVLKDRLKRAEYLLRLNGRIVNAEQNSEKPDQATLFEAMEWREKMADVITRPAMEALQKQASMFMEQVAAEVAESFVRNDLNAAARNTIRFKYAVKFLEDVKLQMKRATA